LHAVIGKVNSSTTLGEVIYDKICETTAVLDLGFKIAVGLIRLLDDFLVVEGGTGFFSEGGFVLGE